MATPSQHRWNGSHPTKHEQFSYGGTVDEFGRLSKIESTVELHPKEVEQIEDFIRQYRARYALVRPAPGGKELDIELRGGRPFERIRRITGYLTGSLETWNSAKRAEEHDRVKHGLAHPEEEINNHIRED